MPSTSQQHESGEAAPRQRLSLFDSTCIIVGIIIGAGVYESTPLIANCVGSSWQLVGVFLLGGLASLLGAMCYAELATTYPRDGGEYVYLSRAFGRRMGFLFAWGEFWVIRPGNVGAMAYVFARYAQELAPLPAGRHGLSVYAATAILVFTVVNILGVQTGKWTQNLLTAAKVLGLLTIFFVGMWIAAAAYFGEAPVQSLRTAPEPFGGLGLAMVFVLFAYGGWNEMSFVAAEVRRPEKNILRALLLGTVAVTTIYVLVVLSFLAVLGFDGVRAAQAIASETVQPALGSWGAIGVALLVAISCLGSIHGMIFTGSRVYYALGTEHQLYRWLGKWNDKLGSPVRSLVLQGIVTMGLVIIFGQYDDGFERLVIFTAPLFWAFFLLSAISLFVLRWTEPHTPRPYRVAFYPVTPLLFLLTTFYMLYSAESYALNQDFSAAPWYVWAEAFAPAAIMLAGLAASIYDPPVKA